VPRISEFANSQNKVSAADFFANHPFHIRMEEYSRRLLAPRRDGATRDTRWFYERARGQYQDERARAIGADRTRFDLEYPKDQLFTKTDLAKFENSWIGEPHVVSDGAQKNFSAFAKRIGEEWRKHEDRFDEIWFRRLVAKGILFRRLEHLVPRQPWYQGGYRANVVTYALAKIAHDAEAARRAVDLDLIWRRQSTSAAMDDALIRAAEAVQSVITSPPAGIRNMSEWAKKQGCWAQAKTLRVAWPAEYLDELITPTDAREAARDAHQEEREGERIAALTQVVNAGPDFWRGLRSWGRERRALTPREDGILDTCSRIPDRIPSDAQANVAMTVYGRLQTLGCELRLGG
jgi:hypothetical protein